MYVLVLWLSFLFYTYVSSSSFSVPFLIFCAFPFSSWSVALLGLAVGLYVMLESKSLKPRIFDAAVVFVHRLRQGGGGVRLKNSLVTPTAHQQLINSSSLKSIFQRPTLTLVGTTTVRASAPSWFWAPSRGSRSSLPCLISPPTAVNKSKHRRPRKHAITPTDGEE